MSQTITCSTLIDLPGRNRPLLVDLRIDLLRLCIVLASVVGIVAGLLA